MSQPALARGASAALPPVSVTPSLLAAAMKIYTRTGDAGETSLFGGGRVPKDHRRVVAYGEVDELNAALGLVAATEPRDFEHALVEQVQQDLFALGGQLASPHPAKVAKALQKTEIPEHRIVELEHVIDRIEKELPELQAFVLPGGTTKAALLHLARTACRRAERGVVHLAREESVPPLILRYLNRLSDLLFALARLANYRAQVPDKTW